MKENTYFILRLLLVGFGLGVLMGITISKTAGLTWFFSYLLCWAFSFSYVKRIRNTIAKSKTQFASPPPSEAIRLKW